MLREFLAVFFGVGTWADSRDRKKKGEEKGHNEAVHSPGPTAAEPPASVDGVDPKTGLESDS